MLELQGVNSFYGRAHVLHDVGFELAAGEVVALLGRNGAGKTTTLKSIMQLVVPSSGDVQFDGQSLIGMPPHQVARLGVGYVPEERRIFTDLTINENLEVGRRPSRPGVPVWTKRELFALFPNLDERQDNRGRELSGGEQQMLTIARTLMGNPTLLLLDEPSEGIAPVIAEQLAHTVLKLKQEGLSVLISEQNLHFARFVADRAIIIESGAKKFDGPFTELDAAPEILEAHLAV